MKIICGTDFSKSAKQAANAAGAISSLFQEPLLLAHIFEGSIFSEYSPVVYDAMLASARKRLHSEAQRLKALGFRVKEILPSGLPDKGLTKLARRVEAALIVVSSHGHRAPERWLLGSVCERTAATAGIPTLVVRKAAPMQSWVQGKRRLKIFVAFDLSSSAEAALRWAKELMEVAPCELIVGFIDWPPAECSRLGYTGPAVALTENPSLVQSVLQRDITARVRQIIGETEAKLRVVPSWGIPAAALVELAQDEHADLIVTGTHGRHGVDALWHGSVSQGILQYSPLSVAIVPSPAIIQSTAEVPCYQRVLIATDFSNLGNNAVPYGYAAIGIGGTVKLVHIMPPGKTSKSNAKRKKQKTEVKTEGTNGNSDLFDQLRSLIPIRAEARGVTTQVAVIEHREPAKAICQEAERFGADLICMGSHGRSGFSKAVLGSVAQEVMTSSPRPVLVVRPPIP